MEEPNAKIIALLRGSTKFQAICEPICSALCHDDFVVRMNGILSAEEHATQENDLPLLTTCWGNITSLSDRLTDREDTSFASFWLPSAVARVALRLQSTTQQMLKTVQEFATLPCESQLKSLAMLRRVVRFFATAHDKLAIAELNSSWAQAAVRAGRLGPTIALLHGLASISTEIGLQRGSSLKLLGPLQTWLWQHVETLSLHP